MPDNATLRIAVSAPTPPVELPGAPALPDPDGDQGLVTHLLPLTGALGSVAMVIGAGQGGSGVRGLTMAAAVVASSLLLVLAQVLRQRGQRRRSVERSRADHLRALAGISAEVRRRQQDLCRRLEAQWPPPSHPPAPYADLEGDGSGLVRIGTTLRGSDLPVLLTDSAGVPDPVCAAALDRFAASHPNGAGFPVLLDRTSTSLITLRGTAESAEAAQRALVLQATRARPEEVAVAVLTDPAELLRWDWLKWLPHAAVERPGAHGATRLVDHRPERLLARLPRRPVLFVVTPGASRTPSPSELPAGSTILSVIPTDTGARTGRVPATTGPEETSDGLTVTGVHFPGGLVLDEIGLADAAATARARARTDARRAGPGAGRAPLLDLIDPLTHRTDQDLLRVVIGEAPGGGAVHLDLKEAARGGHGPHGLVVGATGSGKSELLRTLVVGLVAGHTVDDLALVLVDFKGGATFTDVEELPHVAACVTNLSEDVSLVARMQDALTGELDRRQELLHDHGHSDVHAYRRALAAGAQLPPLPHLLVCVDEFSELLAARPEFAELFTTIGRLGRSLGIHLLLASQRLDEGRLHALEAHLSYRLALRTFSASESRAAIGVPDAHALPRVPGAALFRTGADEPARIDALHVGAPVPSTQHPSSERVTLFTVLPSRPVPVARTGIAATPAPQTVAGLLLGRARTRTAGSAPTHRIWLPPLEGPVPLGSLVGPLARHDDLGLHAPRLRRTGLRLPAAIIDLPRLQRREVHTLDLSGSGGHAAVVGAPRSGRSTALQTLVCALALGRTPSECVLHLIDLGDGALRPLAGLPHVASYSTRQDDVLVERVIGDLVRTVEVRELNSDDGEGGRRPEIVLVVDGWGTLRQEFEDAEAALARLAPRALAVGIHLVTATNRWGDFRPALLDVVASRLELRIGDPYESVVDRRAAAAVPFDRPGRGLTPTGDPLLVAAPALTPEGDLSTLVEAISSSWRGARPPRLHPLPEEVSAADLAPAPEGHVSLGLDVAGATVSHDLSTHLLVEGPERSGRTSVLAHHLAELVRIGPLTQVAVLDPRGRLRGLVPQDQLLGHAATPREATELVAALAATLGRRTGANIEPHLTRPSSPPVRIVVDDLELLGSTGADLSPLVPLLPTAHDLGLALTVAGRPSSLHASDRLITLLGDLGAERLVLDGSRAGRAVAHLGDGRRETVQTPRPSPPQTGGARP